MKRRVRPWAVILGLTSAVAGCDYSAPPPPLPATGPYVSPTSAEPSKEGAESPTPVAQDNADPAMKPVILESVINLIQTAALKPGGDNFKQATVKLNNYFEGTPPGAYLLSSPSREFLLKHMPKEALRLFERTSFEMSDARHLEDCMLYHGIATRVAGTGDDLTRVRRVFDWMIRQVQLVPAQSLAAPGIGQAQARPYDVLVRGMATEGGGAWSERGWLFVALCRQLGIDVGILTYTPEGQSEPTPWICAALLDGKLYLFDARIGLAIPGPDGTGVATLEDALADPVVLGRLDLPGQSAYQVTAAALAKSPSKIGILIDSSPGYLSPRMLLLQESLVGKNRTVLHRDPADQRDQFVKALGSHAGDVSLWTLPIMVENRLFSDPKFVEAAQRALFLYRPEFPLIYARIKQLRGELAEATVEYMNLRFADNPVLMDKKTPMPRDIQEALDHHATYFLALCHLERGDPTNADLFFRQTLRLTPAPGPRQPYFYMFRWGAQANLGHLHRARGNSAQAIAYYAEDDPTAEHHGNLYLARELVWRDPMASPPVPLPPPPPAPPEPSMAPPSNPLAPPPAGP